MEIKDVGQRIAKLRKASGWSQMELAEKLNVSDKTVSKWENGGMPSIDLLPGLSNLFDVSIDYLLTGNDKNVSATKDESAASEEEPPATVKESPQTQTAEETKSTVTNNERAFDRLDNSNRSQRRLPENYVCPKCQRINAHPSDHCMYCYHTFSWNEYKTQSIKSNQGYFNQTVPLAQHAYRTQEEPVGCLAYGVAFLIPIAGLIWGFVKEDKGLKIFSIVMMILNLIVYLALL